MSADALRAEHEAIQRAVQASRRNALTPRESQFVRAMRKVMDDYLDARAAGMTREQAIPGIEAELRESWMHRPSKFGPTCDACGDTGWELRVCWAQQRCERARCVNGHPAAEHTYVSACSCEKGDRVGGRTRRAQLDEISEAMKTRPPRKRGFTRVGS